ncbi:MAG: helix-hairpin-helix domain-containing protein, partial [Verrucomicrobiota bacterium]
TRVRDDEWIPQAKALMSAPVIEVEDDTDYDALISSSYAGESVVSRKGLGVLYTEAPSDEDDLTEINGIGPVLANRLNEDGVYQFRQLADWQQPNIDAFNDRLAFSGRIERDEWVPQAKGLVARADDEANFVAEEITEVPDESAYTATLSKFTGDDVSVDSKLGVVYGSKPSSADDLKEIKGIGQKIEGQLHDFGVYRFRQIADWNDYNVQEFNNGLSFKGRIQRDEWIPQAQGLADGSDAVSGKYGALLSGAFAGEAVTAKPGLGIVYSSAPENADDLTEINGIGPVIEAELNEKGIYRFEQIANWDDEIVGNLDLHFAPNGRVSRDQWVLQAQGYAANAVANANAAEEPEPDKPSASSYSVAMDALSGEPVEVNDRLGVIYSQRPSEQDDLKRISGVGRVLEGKLNEQGVYRFNQIANWNDYNAWAFSKDLAFPGRVQREEWIPQAQGLVELEGYRAEAEGLISSKYAGQSVKVDSELGVVYLSAPENADDLTQLDGIDADMAAKLNAEGIYTFAQLNALQGAQRKSFAQRFGFGDIDWNGWASGPAVKEETQPAPAKSASSSTESKGIFGGGDDDEDDDEISVEADAPAGGGSGQPDDSGAAGLAVSGGVGAGKGRRVVFIMDVSRSLTPAQLRLSKSE